VTTTEPKNWPPAPPEGLADRGRALWIAVCELYSLEQHELITLEEACRTADRLDLLAAEAVGAPMTVPGFKPPMMVANPVLVEQRQQSLTYGRLIAALRLPDTDESVRPQRRGGPRGVYPARGQNPRWQVSS